MKCFLPLTLSLFLCHCGTEVGNGIAPEPRTGASNDSGTPTSAPESSQGSSKDNAAPGGVSSYVLSASLVAACASPFAESVEGSFLNAQATQGFTVTVATDGKKTVTPINSVNQQLVIAPAPTVSAYAIEATTLSPQVSCSAVSSQTLSDGSVERSVTLSSGALVQWNLTNNAVVSMKVTVSAQVLEQWVKK